MTLHGPGSKGRSKCGRKNVRIADEIGSGERINCKSCLAVYQREQRERDQSKAYIGIEPGCGCVTFVMVAGVESERSERKALRDVIASGRSIEVRTVFEARDLWRHCTHRKRVENVDTELDRLITAKPTRGAA